MNRKFILFLSFFVFVFSFLLWSPKVFAVTPTVETLGDGMTDYVLPHSEIEPNVYKADLVFNVVLDQDSKTAVENALNAVASNDNLGFTWVDDTYSTVTVANISPVIFDEDVVVTVTEYLELGGGDNAELTLIDSSDTLAGEIIYAGGTGEEEDPFQIGTCEQLQNVNYYARGGYYFTLYQDIDCSGTSTWNEDPENEGTYFGFIPLGFTYDSSNDIEYGNSFLGIFNGSEYTISGLYINRPNFVSVGLFGEVGGYDDDAILIKDLTIENANILGYEDAGILAGKVYDNSGGPTVISNVHTSGEIEANAEGVNIGGLVGYLSFSEIYESSSSANVYRMEGRVGGLVGYSGNSHIEDSFATGNVSGTSGVGGLVGYNTSQSLGSIINCYATGNVSGTTSVGGLVGYNQGDDISLSFATGDVSGTVNVGGLVGYNGNNMRSQGEIYTSYATGDVSGISRIGGLVGYNNGHIENTYATGDVSGNGRIGGLVGETEGLELSQTTIINSYATGDVSGNQYVGGLVGENDYDTVINSYSVGNVLGNSYTGGLIGYFVGGIDPYTNYIHNSGWYKQNPILFGIGYDAYNGGNYEGEVNYVVTNYRDFYSSERPIYSFLDEELEIDEEWDFSGVWTEQENDYPLLTNNLEVRVAEEEEEEELDLNIVRLSVSDEGVEGDENSYKFGGSYDISEDGRYVAFVSNADNLVEGDDNEGIDIFVYDTVENSIERIAPIVDVSEEIGEQEISCGGMNASICYVSISDNGRYVAIGGAIEGMGTMGLVGIYDRQLNTVKFIGTEGVYEISEMESNYFDFAPYVSLSGDGQKLGISSPLMDGPNSVYYYDFQTQEIKSSGMASVFFRGSVSKDGINAVTGSVYDINENDTNGLMDIYAVNNVNDIDFENLESMALLELISLKPDGEQFTEDDNINLIFAPFVSGTGRYVTFTTYTNVGGPTGYSTIYLRDREEETTKEIFRSDNGLLNFYVSSMSNDGRFIVFASSAIVANSGMGNSPVYIYDSETEEVTTLVEGMSNNSATISGNGEYIVFASISSSLVDDDTNDSSDIFRIDNPFYEEEVVPVHRRSGSGGGSLPFSTTSTPEVVPQIPTNQQPTPDSSCLPGYLFSPVTGLPCQTSSTSQNLNQTSNSNQTYNFTRTLKFGMIGEDVRQLQIYLNTHGYPVATEGDGSLGHETTYFGLKTKQAVIKFQIANGLTGDGIVGPLTRIKLK